MENEKKSAYYYCVVPKCNSTTYSAPEKLFFHVPNDKTLRKKWFSVMKRDVLSDKTSAWVCEDHFHVESDMENYVRYKLIGGPKKLKKGVLPSKFECQKVKTTSHRKGYEKLERVRYFQQVLSPNIPLPSTSTAEPIEFIEFEKISPSETDPLPTECSTATPQKTKRHKSVQVKITLSTQNKMVNTGSLFHRNVKIMNEDCPSVISDTAENTDSDEDYNPLTSQSSSSSSGQEFSSFKPEFKESVRKYTIMAIENEPKLFLGIPKHAFFIIKLLTEKTQLSHRDIMITFRKIKLNENFKVLAINFGISESVVSKIFKKSVPKIASHMKELIVWPATEDIEARLPISFRYRYNKVTSIIDCLEIQIQKPSNPVHQALTWSEYYGCNTIKYLVSITPDGLVSFLSKGYGGRITDKSIFEDSGYLEKLSPNTLVLADRGFKNIAHLIETKKCQLLRPASVSIKNKNSRIEVIDSKRIASLRIHVERAINRLRQYNMLLPHAAIDKKFIQILDNVIVIVGGLVNCHNKLIREEI